MQLTWAKEEEMLIPPFSNATGPRYDILKKKKKRKKGDCFRDETKELQHIFHRNHLSVQMKLKLFSSVNIIYLMCRKNI